MYCDLLAGLLGTVIVTLYIYLKKNVWSNFIKKLDKPELIAYNRINRTRIWILFASFLFSLVATYGLSYLFNVHLLREKICVYLTLIIIITYTSFIIFPKNDYLELHLKKDLILHWIHINELIKFLLVIGFLVGIFFYFFFSKLFKKIF